MLTLPYDQGIGIEEKVGWCHFDLRYHLANVWLPREMILKGVYRVITIGFIKFMSDHEAVYLRNEVDASMQVTLYSMWQIIQSRTVIFSLFTSLDDIMA